MNNVINLSNTRRKKQAATKRKRKTLCQHGKHQWRVVSEQTFDVKQGCLVTRFQCRYCEAFKTKAL